MSIFRSLSSFNYRTWAAGAIVSNVGTWMQRTAQDWIVLTELTHNNATAVGIVTAFQFAPQLVLLPVTGLAADRIDRRKLLFATQALMGLLALGLGLLTLAGIVRIWHVYFFALLLGCVTAFDSPARQAFVSDLVDERDLPNAVALNATSFHIARLIGPAVAGILISAIGSGWVFLINAASFLAVLGSLAILRRADLRPSRALAGAKARFADGLRYVRQRPTLQVIFVMLFFVCTFGLNFPIFVSTMSVTVFKKGAGEFGLLTSVMAVGSVTGALLSAGREDPGVRLLVIAAAGFGTALATAALMPSYWLFAFALVFVGASAQTFTVTANSTVQVSTEPGLRGRVLALFLAIALGGMPVGAPILGWVADTYGPRWAVGVGAAGALVATLVALTFLATRREPVESAA